MYNTPFCVIRKIKQPPVKNGCTSLKKVLIPNLYNYCRYTMQSANADLNSNGG